MIDRIWIAEIWNVDLEEWEILDSVFYTDVDDARQAILEECQVESGWVQARPWVLDPETKGDCTEFLTQNGIEVMARARPLDAGW